MRIDARCPRCGTVASSHAWSRAVILGAVHEHQPVQTVAVFTRAAWRALPHASKVNAGGERLVLHYDNDSSPVLVSVVVEES